MGGDWLRDPTVYQAYTSLNLLRQALSHIRGQATGDPSEHQPGSGPGFDTALGDLDWDKNGVAEMASYVAPNTAAPGTGATSRIEEAAEKFDHAWQITHQTWTGAAADLMRAHTAVVKGNCEAVKNELDRMNLDLNADPIEQPGFSATQGMDKLTGAVKDKADAIASSTSAASGTVLSKSPSDHDYLAAQHTIELAANEMATYVQGRIDAISREVLPSVAKHDNATVELRDPRQYGAPAQLEEFSYQDYGLIQAANHIAEAAALLTEAKKDLERSAAPATEVFGISANGMEVLDVWTASVNLRIEDLGACIRQTDGIYGAIEKVHEAYRHAEQKTQKEFEKVYTPEDEERDYEKFSGNSRRSDSLNDAIIWHDIKDLEDGAWDGAGAPPEGGDEGTGDGGDDIGGEEE